jgi:Flp pilus assembly protein TadG
MSARRVGAESGRKADHGSAAAELVLIAPVFVAFLGAYVVGSQLLLDFQQVDDAARTAVEAAVNGSTPAEASYAATVTGVAEAIDNGLECSHLEVSTSTGDFQAGGTVGVTVTCSATVPELALVTLPSVVQISASESAAIEPYRVAQP